MAGFPIGSFTNSDNQGNIVTSVGPLYLRLEVDSNFGSVPSGQVLFAAPT